MNFGLGKLATTGGLDALAQDDLESKFAAIQHGWLTEHTLEGEHTLAVAKVILPAEFFTEQAPTDWSVVANHFNQTFLYNVRGQRLWMQVVLRDTTVANTPDEFRILIPDGWVASHDGKTTGWVDNNGTFTAALVSVTAGTRYVSVSKIPAGAWANATANTDVGFTWDFNVRR